MVDFLVALFILIGAFALVGGMLIHHARKNDNNGRTASDINREILVEERLKYLEKVLAERGQTPPTRYTNTNKSTTLKSNRNSTKRTDNYYQPAAIVAGTSSDDVSSRTCGDSSSNSSCSSSSSSD